MSAKALRDAAAILLAEADKMEGKTSTFYGERLGPILEVWNKLIAQYAAEDAAREGIARCYETHKPLWKAAEREGWPSNLGGRFWSGNYKDPVSFTAAIEALMETAEAKAWLAHPLNAHLVPKVPPTV